MSVNWIINMLILWSILFGMDIVMFIHGIVRPISFADSLLNFILVIVSLVFIIFHRNSLLEMM